VDRDAVFADVFKQSISMSSVETEIFLRENYDKQFGIFDHDAPGNSNPLALVSLHPSENVMDYSPLKELLDNFSDRDVTKYFGLSLMEFLELPRYITQEIMEVCRARKAREVKQQQEILKSLPGQQPFVGPSQPPFPGGPPT